MHATNVTAAFLPRGRQGERVTMDAETVAFRAREHCWNGERRMGANVRMNGVEEEGGRARREKTE